MNGEERVRALVLISKSAKDMYSLTLLNEGRRSGHSPVNQKVLIGLMDYNLADELSVYNQGRPIESMLHLQNAFSNMQFYLNLLFKEKCSGMGELMRLYLKLWGEEATVSIKSCVEFERKMRMIVSDGLKDFCFESVQFEFTTAWSRILLKEMMQKPDDIIRSPSDDEICYNYNDGRDCDRSCERLHECLACGRMDCWLSKCESNDGIRHSRQFKRQRKY